MTVNKDDLKRFETEQYTYVYSPGAAGNTQVLLLLHGSGSTEYDLLDLGRTLAPDAHIISPRGNVSEMGMNRFFRRFEDGSFDYEDVVRRADRLSDFISTALKQHGLAAAQVTLLGYSNGANIGAAVMILHPDSLDSAILLRGLYPLQNADVQRLDGKNILMLNGSHDTIIPAERTEILVKYLQDAGAQLDYRILNADHRLTHEDMGMMATWMNELDTSFRS